MIYDGWLNIKDWLKERSRIYDKYVKSMPETSDEVHIEIENLQNGWLEIAFYVNGERKMLIPLSDTYNPIVDIVKWLEAVVDLGKSNNYIEQTLHLDCEQGCHALLHYEQIDAHEFGMVDDERGLFIVYCSVLNEGEETLSAICSMKKLVSNIYLPFVNLFANLPNARFKEQYIIENWNGVDGEIESVMELYNQVKSPLLEWFISQKKHEDWFDKGFSKHRIGRVILMEARKEGLFWTIDGCVGNYESIHLDGQSYDIHHVKGLKNWYVSSIGNNIENEAIGFTLAMEIRRKLPEDVDLFFGTHKTKMVYPNIEVMTNHYPIPDTRQWIKGSHSGMRYMRIK